MREHLFAPISTVALGLIATPVSATPLSFFFSTGSPTNLIATASRPGPASGANQETESADDFILAHPTRLTSASFTGLIPSGASLSDISQVIVESYRVFPKDSNTARTPNVPTRVNSPSDVELADRQRSTGGLSFSTTLVSTGFTTLNSVDIGIHPSPTQNTGGDGAVTGTEVRFDVTFTNGFPLSPDHYFFVPQVLLSDPNDHFLWLSGQRPLGGPGTTPFLPDLQSWIRNDQLAPDWLRIGQDIVGRTTFNSAFSLTGTVVAEPSALLLIGSGLLGLGLLRRRCRR